MGLFMLVVSAITKQAQKEASICTERQNTENKMQRHGNTKKYHLQKQTQSITQYQLNNLQLDNCFVLFPMFTLKTPLNTK